MRTGTPRRDDLGRATELELIQRARDGEREAYGELWSRHVNGLRRHCARMTSRFDPDDLVAETFANVFQAMQAGRGPQTAFWSYMTTSARNLSMTWTARTAPSVSIDMLVPLEGVDDPAQTVEDTDMLRRALSSLPDRWRRALWHREVEGATTAQMMSMFETSEAGVAMLLYRARRGLRRAWEVSVESDSAGAHGEGRLRSPRAAKGMPSYDAPPHRTVSR